MVLAGPGSGKTTVLLKRLQYLIECCEARPESFLVITYTKAAAQSMEQRFLLSTSPNHYPVTFSTFHSFFYQILRKHAGIGPDSFLSETEKYNLLLPILQQYQNQESPVVWLERFGRFKNAWTNQNAEEDIFCVESFMDIYEAYEQSVKRQNKTDYDNLAPGCLELFLKYPQVLAEWQKKYRYIFMDEFQDINGIQYAVIKKLAQNSCQVFAVGDDDQSIYGFRGSNPDIMKEFMKDFQPATQLVLSQNYRSNSGIVSGSQKVINENTNRIPKDLQAAEVTTEQTVHIYAFPTSEEEYDFLAERIREYERLENRTQSEKSKIMKEKTAVIVRTNELAREVERQLRYRQICCQIKGRQLPLSEHFAVQDILAYLQLAKGEKERKFFLQIRNKPNRGIVRDALDMPEVCLDNLLGYYKTQPDILENVMRLWQELETIRELPLFLAINYIRKKTGYDRYLIQRAEEAREEKEQYLKVADRLQEESKGYTDLQEFLSHIRKNWTEPEECRNVSNIRILTMHMAKGLEFERVFLPDLNAGILPKGKNLKLAEIEEERRLFYVAMTRAKKTLDILYLTGTEQYPRHPSLFLNPLL